ncbi:FecR protein [Anaerohalosphaera lusitana]|uniref:FecR protein n=1 Tax=Anaerohalosphaera lusitana TaxID=1936003 RepID=A0A1U9NQI0_9BACT|nr:FecR domain-containing protein [Anaerohalosphaera lusitana]AQT70037.1 FecR protein [Anaerohalosphaera lusitana]
MISDDQRIALCKLIMGLMDGSITDHGLSVLNQQLAQSPEALEFYREFMKNTALLKNGIDLSQSSLSDPISSDFWAELSKYEMTAPAVVVSEQEEGRNIIQKVEYPQREKHKLSKFQIVTLIISSAALLFVVFILNFVRPKEGSIKVATLVDQVDAEWTDEGVRWTNGVGFWTGDSPYLLTKGFARILSNNGADVIIESPAKFEMRDTDEIFLYYGKVACSVPPKAYGFKIQSADFEITDLGTEFGVTVRQNQSSEVSVFDGKVEMASLYDKHYDNVLTAGQAKQVSYGSGTVSDIPCDRYAYKQTWKDVLTSVEVKGSIDFLRASPKSLEQDAFESDSKMFLIEERKSVPLQNEITGLISSGQYTSQDLTLDTEAIPGQVDKPVDSFLLHIDRVGGTSFEQNLVLNGTIAFRCPIVGVLVDTDKIIESDSLFGNPNVDYSDDINRGITGESSTWREIDESTLDVLTLSEDRKTLMVKMVAGNFDQIRILVESP